MDNQTPQELNINLGMNMDEFEGKTVHLFQVFSSGMETKLDCIYVDFSSATASVNEIPGKVVARLNMSTDRLVELRDLLNNHIENITKTE